MNLQYLQPHHQLDPEIWEACCDHEKCPVPKHYCLKTAVRKALLRISHEFYLSLNIPVPLTDVIFTGSMSNYNYSTMSDIDLHLLLNFSEIDENEELVRDFLNAKKTVWNDQHEIMIKGHEVEVYAQDRDEIHHSTGVYSLIQDEWIEEPQNGTHSINLGAVETKAQSLINIIDTALESPNRMEKLTKVKEKIKKMRQCGLETGGEYSVENLAFKVLRRNGYLEKLYGTYTQDYDSSLSMESIKR